MKNRKGLTNSFLNKASYDSYKAFRNLYKLTIPSQKLLYSSEFFSNIAETQRLAQKALDTHKHFFNLIDMEDRFFKAAKIHELAIKTQEAFQKSAEKISKEAIEALIAHPPYFEQIESVTKEAFEAVTRHENILKDQLLTQKAVNSLFDRNSNNLFNAFENLSRLQAQNLKFKDFNINSDGSVTYEDETIYSDELNEAVENFFDHIDEINFFDKFEERLGKLKEPIRAIIIWIFEKVIVTFIIGISIQLSLQHQNELQNKLDQFLFGSKREITNYVKKLSPEINLTHFKDHRIVIAEKLHLREKPNMKSRIIDELNRGKLVKVLMKNRNWTMVEVFYDEGESLKGWATALR
jgi:hypothetical protein